MLPISHAPSHQAPEFPAGPYVQPTTFDADALARHLEILAGQPSRLRFAIQGLSQQQLEMRYRNWTVRQIVHHLADSTANMYIRWKLALTEVRPTVKPYDESDWAKLPDSLLGDPAWSLSMFDAVLGRMLFTARAMAPNDYHRIYWHPQYEREVALWQLAALYAWHGSHHIGQIEWLRQHYRW
jgi:hypothetical protein